MRYGMCTFVIAAFVVLASCAGPRYETELRIRILEEQMKLLDAKVDSSLKERR